MPLTLRSVSRLQVYRRIHRLRIVYNPSSASTSFNTAVGRVSRNHTQGAQAHTLSLSNLETTGSTQNHASPGHSNSAKAGTLSPMQQYHTLVETGALRADDHQTRIIQILQDLHVKLVDYQPPNIPPAPAAKSFFSRILSSSSPQTLPDIEAPQGLYLYGDVGTGKTMLMDLFFNTLPTSVTRKRRVHFHAFMIDVHKRIHAVKLAMGHDGGDPIPTVVRELAQQANVLCFDEFQVTDIADAMILRRLFEGLKNLGVVMVITSNRHPDELYKNGIQRLSFIPCIDLLKEHFDVTDLDSGTDYRRIPRALSHVYYHPLTDENHREVNKIFASFESPLDPIVSNRKLETWGRTILIPESTSVAAKFSFDDLCSKPLSAADFLEITRNFGTIFVLDIPKMGLDRKDQARRFITFIDACYESKTKLFVTSELLIYKIFSDNSKDNGAISDHMRGIMDDLGLSVDTVGVSSMFSGEEEVFAFARCCSRLVQMGSREWAETAGANPG